MNVPYGTLTVQIDGVDAMSPHALERYNIESIIGIDHTVDDGKFWFPGRRSALKFVADGHCNYQDIPRIINDLTIGGLLGRFKKFNPTVFANEIMDTWTVLVYIGGNYYQIMSHLYKFIHIPSLCSSNLIITRRHDQMLRISKHVIGDLLLPGQHVLFDTRVYSLFRQYNVGTDDPLEIKRIWFKWFVSTPHGSLLAARTGTDALLYRFLHNTVKFCTNDAYQEEKQQNTTGSIRRPFRSVNINTPPRNGIPDVPSVRATTPIHVPSVRATKPINVPVSTLRAAIDSKKQLEDKLKAIAKKRHNEKAAAAVAEIEYENEMKKRQNANASALQTRQQAGFAARETSDKRLQQNDAPRFSLYDTVGLPRGTSTDKIKKAIFAKMRKENIDRQELWLQSDVDIGVTKEIMTDLHRELIRAKYVLCDDAETKNIYDQKGDWARFRRTRSGTNFDKRFGQELPNNPYVI